MKKRLKKKLKICCECGRKCDDVGKNYGRNGHLFCCGECLESHWG